MSTLVPYEIIHHILQFAVDFEYSKTGLYLKQDQMECIALFQLVNREFSEFMESFFNTFWLNVLKRDVVNLEFFHKEDLEKELIVSKTVRRKVLLTRMCKRKLNSSNNENRNINVVVTGPLESGKSSLYSRFTGVVFDQFNFEIEPEHRMKISIDGEEENLQIIDMSGAIYFEGYILPIMKQGATFIIVVSNNNVNSLQETRRFLILLLKATEHRIDIPITFAINKIDEVDYSIIEFWRVKIGEMIKEFKLINVGIIETSAVNNVNVTELFEYSVIRYKNGTLQDIELLKKVISQDVMILNSENKDTNEKHRKCICM